MWLRFSEIRINNYKNSFWEKFQEIDCFTFSLRKVTPPKKSITIVLQICLLCTKFLLPLLTKFIHPLSYRQVNKNELSFALFY